MNSPTSLVANTAEEKLHTPLVVRSTATHGVSLFDANDSSLGVDFEQHTADEIALRCNSFDALTEANARLLADAERYRFLRGNVRARFADTLPLEPQLVYTKRSDPFIQGYAERVDAAVDAALKAAKVTP
jgi:hypothetical protein